MSEHFMTQDEMAGRKPMSQDTREIIEHIAEVCMQKNLETVKNIVMDKVSIAVSNHKDQCPWPGQIGKTIESISSAGQKHDLALTTAQGVKMGAAWTARLFWGAVGIVVTIIGFLFNHWTAISTAAAATHAATKGTP